MQAQRGCCTGYRTAMGVTFVTLKGGCLLLDNKKGSQMDTLLISSIAIDELSIDPRHH
jgi:hypothetical protein